LKVHRDFVFTAMHGKLRKLLRHRVCSKILLSPSVSFHIWCTFTPLVQLDLHEHSGPQFSAANFSKFRGPPTKFQGSS